MTTATKAAPEPALAAAPSGRRRKLLLIAGLLASLAAVWYLLIGPGIGSKADPAAAEPTHGEVVPLEAITMNLADGRLLKVGLALQLVKDDKAEVEINGSMALDEAITYLGEHTYAQLASAQARQQVKAELSKRVADRYHQDVLEVYFTEFVMR